MKYWQRCSALGLRACVFGMYKSMRRPFSYICISAKHTTVMFCSSCGMRMQINYKFCPSCGNTKGHDNDEENRNALSSESQTSSQSTTSFKSFMIKKQEERASHFRPSKKPGSPSNKKSP